LIRAANVIASERVVATYLTNELALVATIISFANNIGAGASLRYANLIVVNVIIAAIASTAEVKATFLNKIRIAIDARQRESRGTTAANAANIRRYIHHPDWTTNRTGHPNIAALADAITIAFIVSGLSNKISSAIDETRIIRGLRRIRATFLLRARSSRNRLALRQLPLTGSIGLTNAASSSIQVAIGGSLRALHIINRSETAVSYTATIRRDSRRRGITSIRLRVADRAVFGGLTKAAP